MDFDPKKNYYEILGVSENATKDEIKKAFKKLAVKLHPDRGGDQAKFQEVNEAHSILSDDKKKQQYDAFRKGGFGGGFGDSFGGGGFGGGGFDFGDEIDLGDIVGNIFGGGFGGGTANRRSRVRKGTDIKKQIMINFDESYLGTKKKIKYSRMKQVPGAEKTECSTCKGKGTVFQQVRTPLGVMQTQSACDKCGGVGYIFKKDGKTLPAGGLEQAEEIIEVKIPAGINDGVYIKFSGKGNEGVGNAPSGDLYIKINIPESDKYVRKGDDLYVKCPMTIFDLVLGGECKVDHPEGKLTVKVPKGTQIGDYIKISGKGFGESGVFSSKGNMYIEPEITIPKRLNKKQEKLWKELQNL